MKKVKKTPTTLTLKEKCEVLQYIDKNPEKKHTLIADYFAEKFKKDFSRRSIKNWIENKDRILGHNKCDVKAKNCKKDVKFKTIEDFMIQYISKIEEKDGFLTDALLKQKASKFAQETGVHDFKASNGWLEKFKSRYSISLKALCGEKGRKTKEDYDDFYNDIKTVMSNFSDNNIFNADETALFYKFMPTRTQTRKHRSGSKNYKDRVTILLCCNKDGSEKLPPYIIGKHKSPRAFKKFDHLAFCQYTHNSSAWMSVVLFNEWLYKINEDMKIQKRKILILLDNATVHKITSDFSQIDLYYLPKNSTCITQPLDAGIIRSFKAKYSKHQLEYIDNHLEEFEKAYMAYKSLNLADAISFTYYAWKEVSQKTIVNCWKNAGYTITLTSQLPENTEIKSVEEINDEIEQCATIMKRLSVEEEEDIDGWIELEVNHEDLDDHDTEIVQNEEDVIKEVPSITTERLVPVDKVFSLHSTINAFKKVRKHLQDLIFENGCDKGEEILDAIKLIEKTLLKQKGKTVQADIKDYLIKL